MLQPKRIEFRKMHKGRNHDLTQGTDISFGSFGLRVIGHSRLTARQIEAARHTVTHAVKCQGKIRIRVLLNKPITEESPVVRMDKGKDNVEYWAVLV